MPDQAHIDTGLDDLDAARLKKLNAGKNASHTSVYTVSGLLQSIRKQIDQTVTDNTPAIARCHITRGNYRYLSMLYEFDCAVLYNWWMRICTKADVVSQLDGSGV